MRILSLLYVYFLVVVSQGVSVPTPVNTKVVSNNFIHILQWNPGAATQPGTVYNVQVGNDQSRSISGTSLDITEYMKNAYLKYQIKLWASFGNSSSSEVTVYFTPYERTTIGPPILSLTGCGDCLNISIDLPNRQSAPVHFYQAIHFNISWWKVRDEKDDCRRPPTDYQNKLNVPYSSVLHYLQPGERYCVEVQPKSVSAKSVRSGCSCEYTSRVEPRGVAFLVGCVLSSVLVGLCFLGFIFSLVYTGFLCKPNVRLPKALIIRVPGPVLSPEDTTISVAVVEFAQSDHEVNVDDDEDEESDHDYMEREAPRESESTGSQGPAAAIVDFESSNSEDVHRDSGGTTSLNQVRHDGDGRGGSGEAPALAPPTTNPNPRNAQEKKKLAVQIKEEESDDDGGGDHCENVNLWSVVLKSMQPEEEEDAGDPSEARKPLLPLLLTEGRQDSLGAAKPQTGRFSQLHSALLSHTQTELLSDQEDEHDVPDASVCERMTTGYMASHTGTIDTEICLSQDEDEGDASDYMTR